VEQFARLQKLNPHSDGIVGTPYYMAPEQSLAPWLVDNRADVFGLGAILYFILTGQRIQYVPPPMDLKTLEERKRILDAWLEGFVAPPRDVSDLLKHSRDGLPKHVLTWLQECEDISGVQSGSSFHKFRMTMRNCEIRPPSQVLASRHVALITQEFTQAFPELIDPAVEAICMKALSKDPERRFPSCSAMWQALLPHTLGPEGTCAA
jgi:serine/threonine protein kinase